MENNDQEIERNRVGCKIHNRQEKVRRVEIGKELRGYRLIENHKRRKGEIIGLDEPIRSFFFSLEGDLNLKPVSKPIRIARFRLCEWVHPESTVDKYGNRRGDLDEFLNATTEEGKERAIDGGCKIVVDEIEAVPIYQKCLECHRSVSNQEEIFQKELDYLCVECFCDETEQQHERPTPTEVINIWSNEKNPQSWI